jgi:hypothetical protein
MPAQIVQLKPSGYLLNAHEVERKHEERKTRTLACSSSFKKQDYGTKGCSRETTMQTHVLNF